jgi:hypothetical protein
MARRSRDRRGDALAGPPDSTRPRNPWPRLLAFFAALALAVLLVGVCVVSFATPPPRDLRLDVTSIEPGLPRFLPVIPFGADPNGFTYGAWITTDGAGVAAYLARQPQTTCRLEWSAAVTTEADARGAFVDPCGDARYTIDGTVADGSAGRDLDAFPTRIDGGEIIVDITTLRLGNCVAEATGACSPPDEERFIDVPNDELPDDFVAE